MQIVIITPFYAPDLGPSAALYEMLCEEMALLGNEVSVISAVPHYPTGRVRDGFRGRLIQREFRNGVHVTRVWVPSLDRTRLGFRLLSFVCYQLLAAAVGWRQRFDVLIASGPAFEVALPLFILGVLRRKPFVYSVHEVYPEVGIKLGILRHRPVIKLVEWMELFCCNRATFVRVISEGYKKALEAKGVLSEKLAVIWDWIDTDFIQPLPRRNAFSAQWGLDDHFVVMYAGNIGPTQGLEHVVEAARGLIDVPTVRIVFVGDGGAKVALQQLADHYNLKNTLFIPYQSREMLPQVLATADVSLVALRKGLGTDSVPSKLFSILASGRPVIATVDGGSDTSNLLHKLQCGVTVDPENPKALANAVLDLYQDANCRRCFAEKGRNHAVKLRSKKRAAEEFQQLIFSITSHQKSVVEEGVI